MQRRGHGQTALPPAQRNLPRANGTAAQGHGGRAEEGEGGRGEARAGTGQALRHHFRRERGEEAQDLGRATGRRRSSPDRRIDGIWNSGTEPSSCERGLRRCSIEKAPTQRGHLGPRPQRWRHGRCSHSCGGEYRHEEASRDGHQRHRPPRRRWGRYISGGCLCAARHYARRSTRRPVRPTSDSLPSARLHARRSRRRLRQASSTPWTRAKDLRQSGPER